MSQKEKLIEKFKRIPSGFTYDELLRLMSYFDYEEFQCGKTSGSRVTFICKKDKYIIYLHKPHPGSIVSKGRLKSIYDKLVEHGDIEE